MKIYFHVPALIAEWMKALLPAAHSRSGPPGFEWACEKVTSDLCPDNLASFYTFK